MNRVIQVFEHFRLLVSEEENLAPFEISNQEFQSLMRFYEKVSDQFFSIERKGIKFKHYVGVLQVGGLTVEILPKIGKEQDSEKWAHALYEMVRVAKNIKYKRGTLAFSKFSSHTILELYLSEFLKEVENVLRVGLRKNYRLLDSNRSSLKGKILFEKDCLKNHTDKTKVFCRHQVFDFSNPLNQIIKYSLKIVTSVSQIQETRVHARKIFELLDGVQTRKIGTNDLSRITYNRNNSYYKTAITLAEFIIQNYSPKFKASDKEVISFMFDMNDLFEEFVFKSLKKNLSSFRVERRRITYWNNRRLIPDIVLTRIEDNEVFIIDTKWKTPQNSRPDDSDLRQVFAYNEYFNASLGVLLYPQTGSFLGEEGIFKEKDHVCKTAAIELFNSDNKIDSKRIASEVLAELKVG
jgi:5-methylcytosine-specific restriction enzyme subunit McrC